MGEASGLPEMLVALAIGFRAAQSDIAQHAVVELQEQVPAPRAFSPSPKPAQQGSGSEEFGEPIGRKLPGCIDAILMSPVCISYIGARPKSIDPE